MNVIEIFEAETKRREDNFPKTKEIVAVIAEKHGMTKVNNDYFISTDKGWVKLIACWNSEGIIKIAWRCNYRTSQGVNSVGNSVNFYLEYQKDAEECLASRIKTLQE